ncbi:MAG: DUF4416 family protein [Candidatus Marinimicrobia bacterium]|nr:DUF4416 family protein [Candidatus Neomarinimicrobiota bacterium]HDN60035.1 DUF4416 family protein [Candidatus Neomarinimicrobiota bacterium]
MEINIPRDIKLFVGCLYTSKENLASAIKELEKYFGIVDLESEDFPFDVTNYYEKEMGKSIKRKFFSFSKLFNPIYLLDAKLITNEVEKTFSIEGKRSVNLDVGYMDFDKVVLASAKYCIHKIYIGRGIYADMTLHYEKGQYYPYPWAFPDFKLDRYYRFFLKMREIYKKQMKERKRF